MKRLTRIALLLFVSSLSSLASAQPEPGPDSPVTRSELVTEMESSVSEWEEQLDGYATRDQLEELRDLLLRMDKEMNGASDGERGLDGSVEQLERRVEHLRRPGF